MPAAEAERRCSELLDRCRARGIRITPQRLAVYRELARDSSHPTAEALYARLRPGMASLSLATIYRILEFLERERLVRRVSTTDAAGRFDANLSRHHHLVCRHCGKMTDFEERFLVRPALPRQVLGAFRAEELDVRILGTCESCRREASGGRKKKAIKTKTRGSRPRNGGR
jgi:Fur family peroxide stress response transcriptional regulator